MFMKMLFIALVLFGLLFSNIAGQCFADIPAQFKQAEAYKKTGNYERAEAIYKQIVTDYALQAQKKLTILYIAWGKRPQEEAAFQRLIANFSEHKGIAKAVHDIAFQCRRFRKYEKAIKLYQYVLDNWPKNDQAIWSQKDIAKANVESGNEAGAQAAFEKLLANFSADERIAEAVCSVGDAYYESGRYKKAAELCQYVLDNWPDDDQALRALKNLAMSRAALGDDAGTDAAIGKLLIDFSEHPGLAGAVRRVADSYRYSGRYEKAIKLYQYILANWPEDVGAIHAQKGVAISYVGLGNEPAAQAALDKLITDFKDHSGLPIAVWGVAEAYYNQAFQCEKEGMDARAKGHFAKVITIGQRILQQWGASAIAPEVCHISAVCYGRLGQHRKAIKYYQKLADYQPDYPYASRAPSMVRLIKKYIKNMEEIARSGAEPPPPPPRRLDKNVNSNEGGQK